MRITVLAAAAACLLALVVPPVQADPGEDYTALRVAELINYKCGALKYVEHRYIIEAQSDALRQSTQWSFLETGRISQDDYNRWVDERDAEAEDQAEAVGCTQAAEPYIMDARGKAQALISQGLLLAFHFDALPETDTYRQLLYGDQKQAAMAFDGFQQQLYGANHQDFMAYQRRQAAALLPTSSDPASQYDPYGFNLYMPSNEDIEKINEARRLASNAIDIVHFEVAAEFNGWRVEPKPLEGGWSIPTLIRADATDPNDRLVVVEGPFSYALADYSGSFQQLLARAPDGTLRLMIFGEVAATLGANPGARFYVPNMPLPAGSSEWSYFNEPTYRDLALTWDGTPSPGPCLGGPCFDFPPEVFDAIARRGDQGYAELFIGNDPAAVPPPIEPGSYRSGRIASRFFAMVAK